MITVSAQIERVDGIIRVWLDYTASDGSQAIAEGIGQTRDEAILDLHLACDEVNLPEREFDVPELEVEKIHQITDEMFQASLQAATNESPSDLIKDLGINPNGMLGMLDQGWVTPTSNREHWLKAYRAALETVSRMDQGRDDGLEEKPWERSSRIRGEINAIMHQLGCVGAYNKMGNGDNWLSVTGELDTTVRPSRAGDGDRRDRARRYVKNELTEEEERPRRGYGYGSFEQRQQAHNYAKNLAEQAEESAQELSIGLTKRDIAYRLGYVMVLRSMRLPPHERFEAELKALGFTEEHFSRFLERAS